MKKIIPVAGIILLLIGPAVMRAQQPVKYWVVFTDKEIPPVMLEKRSMSADDARAYISERAVLRREKTFRTGPLIDETDLPVNQNYIGILESRGIRIENVLRWFNAVTAYLSPEQSRELRGLPFVKDVCPVRSVRRGSEPEADTPIRQRGLPLRKEASPLDKLGASPPDKLGASLDHGLATQQLKAINILPVHDAGVEGAGVIIGMLDTGFRWKTNDALKNTRVLAEYDFIFKDSVTANQAEDVPGQDQHGTMTLSTIAANINTDTTVCVGAAPLASFILAKTEDIRSEHKVEEDNWAAAIEWMERLGADVVSSSLGYSTFNPPDQSYTWANGDFNGRTTITAQAAILAARKGVLVVNAMGNERNGDGVTGTLITPADADSILAVGAVRYTTPDSGLLASFSSTGPTNDGRIKPDVVAPGVDDVVLEPAGIFVTGSGTSFATPLVAGAAALIFSGHPGLTAMEVRDALRKTANNSLTPNNFYGWGGINAMAAFQYYDSTIPSPPVSPNRYALYQSFPNPLTVPQNGTTTIRFDIPEPAQVVLSVYSVLGQKVRTLVDGNLDARRYEVPWDGIGRDGYRLASGVYYIVLRTPQYTTTMKMILVR